MRVAGFTPGRAVAVLRGGDQGPANCSTSPPRVPRRFSSCSTNSSRGPTRPIVWLRGGSGASAGGNRRGRLRDDPRPAASPLSPTNFPVRSTSTSATTSPLANSLRLHHAPRRRANTATAWRSCGGGIEGVGYSSPTPDRRPSTRGRDGLRVAAVVQHVVVVAPGVLQRIGQDRHRGEVARRRTSASRVAPTVSSAPRRDRTRRGGTGCRRCRGGDRSALRAA